jgi:hypothetical protein
MGAFLRTAIDDNNLIRGAARLIAAPLTTPFPSQAATLSQLIKLTTSGAVNDEQTLTIAGTPTGGTFTLRQYGDVTAAIKYNATAKEVEAALRELPSVGANVEATGGPFPGTPVVLKFIGAREKEAQPLVELAANSMTGGTTPTLTVAHTVVGAGIYDAISPWFELGATKTGVKITRNNTEDVFDVDQIYGDLDARPTNWEMTIVTALAEATLAKIQVAWELGNTFVDSTPTTGPEEHLGIGLPTSYVHRRLAVLYQRPNGLIRALVFRRVVKMPQESDITYMKSGEQITMAFTFRCLIDPTISDPTQNLGEVVDQAVE